MIGEFRSVFVCFVFQGSLLCDRPISGINRLVKFALQIFFWSFLFLSLARIKRSLPPSLDKKSPNYRHSLPYSWAVSLGSFSAKLGEHVVICINPAFTKMIDRTEKPKIPSKSALRAARYNEFRCKWINSRIEGDLPFSRKKNKRSQEGEERGFTYAWAEHYLQPNTVERHCA